MMHTNMGISHLGEEYRLHTGRQTYRETKGYIDYGEARLSQRMQGIQNTRRTSCDLADVFPPPKEVAGNAPAVWFEGVTNARADVSEGISTPSASKGSGESSKGGLLDGVLTPLLKLTEQMRGGTRDARLGVSPRREDLETGDDCGRGWRKGALPSVVETQGETQHTHSCTHTRTNTHTTTTMHAHTLQTETHKHTQIATHR